MMSEPRYKSKKVIEGGVIKWKKVPIDAEDIIAEKDLEISRLKILVNELRNKISILEQEQQRYSLLEAVDSADSYNIYK
jgi:hypothetical protein